MTAKEALKKHGISQKRWDLFLGTVKGNVNPPERKKYQRKKAFLGDIGEWIRKNPGWAYLGGMRDALWAWVDKDQEAHDVLYEEFLNAIQDRILDDLHKETYGIY
jgi:hypothetical protein